MSVSSAIVNSSVKRRRHQRQWQIHVVQRFSVADEQIAKRRKTCGKFSQNALLRRAIKIDDHIAAEDSIRLFRKTILCVHEIQVTKLDHATQLRHDSHPACSSNTATQEVLSLGSLWNAMNRFFRVNASARLLQHNGRNVGGQNAKPETWMCLRIFAKNDTQRVRLLARR